MSRRWAATSVAYKRGIYWNIRTGRGRDRANLSLGYVTEVEARRAADRMTTEERFGRASRIVEWHKEDRVAAVRYLVGDAGVDGLINGEPDYGRMPLRDYYNEIFREWRAESAAAGWRSEQRVWDRILEVLGDRELREIDAHIVADYLDALVARTGPRAGQALSGNAKRLHRAAIKALLKRAFRLRHIPSLPDLAVFRIKGATRRAVDKPAPLSLEELVALMEASGPKHRAMWAVGGGQGLRPSELGRIRWEDVDFEGRTLAVRGTKTEQSAAVVPMTGLTRRELRSWWEASDSPQSGLVFLTESGKPYGHQGYKKPLRTAARKAGIERRVYPYLLRDSFATIAWSLGIDMDIARRILRHTDDTMLRDVYCRPRPEDIARFVEVFDITE